MTRRRLPLPLAVRRAERYPRAVPFFDQGTMPHVCVSGYVAAGPFQADEMIG